MTINDRVVIQQLYNMKNNLVFLIQLDVIYLFFEKWKTGFHRFRLKS